MVRVLRSDKRQAFTITEVIVLLAVIAACICVLVLTLVRRTELQRRVACAKNLEAIERGMWMYGAENHDDWPVAAHASATQDRVSRVEYVRAIGSYRGRADDPQAGNTDRIDPAPTHLSTTRNLWTLFRLKLVTRAHFICPSSMDVENTEPNARAYWDFGLGDIEGPATPDQSRIGYAQVSYGYQMPYGKHFLPSSDYSHFWPVAEKGPFSAALEAGLPEPPPSFPTQYDLELWRPWNSPNHGGEGQNKISGMSGVEFSSSPHGWSIDFIYTQCPPRSSMSYSAGRVYGGAPPAVGLKLAPDPAGPNGLHLPDTLIYP